MRKTQQITVLNKNFDTMTVLNNNVIKHKVENFRV